MNVRGAEGIIGVLGCKLAFGRLGKCVILPGSEVEYSKKSTVDRKYWESLRLG